MELLQEEREGLIGGAGGDPNLQRCQPNEKRVPGGLGFFKELYYPSYMGNTINHYKDPY